MNNSRRNFFRSLPAIFPATIAVKDVLAEEKTKEEDPIIKELKAKVEALEVQNKVYSYSSATTFRSNCSFGGVLFDYKDM